MRYLLTLLVFGMALTLPIVSVTALNTSTQNRMGDLDSIEGDIYADAILTSRSAWYGNGENALGAPDNENATIYADYGYGYLTLDMGYEEEILNGTGADFTVIAEGDSYRIGVTSDLDISFTYYPAINGTQDFDLNALSLDSARYVRIELMSGNAVYLDAIVAIHYNSPSDDGSPIITALDDILLDPGVDNVTLDWSTSDEYPLNYTIFMNGTAIDSDSWNGANIVYTAIFTENGVYNITLLLFDAFGNHAEDTVMVTVPEEATTPSLGVDLGTLLMIGLGVSVIAIIIALYVIRKRSP